MFPLPSDSDSSAEEDSKDSLEREVEANLSEESESEIESEKDPTYAPRKQIEKRPARQKQHQEEIKMFLRKLRCKLIQKYFRAQPVMPATLLSEKAIVLIARYQDIVTYEKLRTVWKMEEKYTGEILDGVRMIDEQWRQKGEIEPHAVTRSQTQSQSQNSQPPLIVASSLNAQVARSLGRGGEFIPVVSDAFPFPCVDLSRPPFPYSSMPRRDIATNETLLGPTGLFTLSPVVRHAASTRNVPQSQRSLTPTPLASSSRAIQLSPKRPCLKGSQKSPFAPSTPSRTRIALSSINSPGS